MLKLAAYRAGGTRHGKGFFDLAKNLRFADNHGVETGRHAEEMTHGILIAILEEMWKQHLRFDPEVIWEKTC